MLFDHHIFRFPATILACLSIVCLADAATCATEGTEARGPRWDFGHHKVTRIPPGTPVGNARPDGWNRLVLFATPRLAAGAVSSIPRMAQSYATRFNVVIMAGVSAAETSGATKRYQLDRVGIGYCISIGGNDVVISSDSQDELRAGLNTIEQIVLKKNEEVLNDVVQIARSNTFIVFDVKAIMLDRGKHKDMFVRHMVWVYPETGKVASLVWPLVDESRESYRFVGKFLYALPEGFREDRIIHVSADEITFGIPSSRAFALARMPPGKKIAVTPEITRLAGLKRYDREHMASLVKAVRGRY